MRLSLSGDTAAFLLLDDPFDPATPSIGVQSTSFRTDQTWFNCCTDGFVIGSLDGDFALLSEFDAFSGLNTWNAVSSDGSTIALDMGLDRRVRFDLAPVPEPSAVFILMIGLLGLSSRRKLAW